MGDQLLVRMYDVGLGDCIYLRVPDTKRDRHILIDCGNKFSSMDLLERAAANLEEELDPHPNDATKKQLDLLIVTHPHEDHHKGFEESFFANIQVDRIWLSPAYDRLKNPKAKQLNALWEAVDGAAARLAARTPAGPYREMLDDVLALSKSAAIQMLTTTLPARCGIEATYVSADSDPGELAFFDDSDVRLQILAPMEEIDEFYLGGGNQAPHLALAAADGDASFLKVEREDEPAAYPSNISRQDFDRLRKGIQPNVLAAADRLGHALNNLSVVLLIEWRGKRLLFPGDAEWSGARIEVREGGLNGSWNVMWQERKAELSQPLDFLKVGHHGSENATPWARKGDGSDHPICEILDHLIPVPQAGTGARAKAIVSTVRTTRWPSIPDPEVIRELGVRVANRAEDYADDGKIAIATPQPQRTDLESYDAGRFWIDVIFSPT